MVVILVCIHVYARLGLKESALRKEIVVHNKFIDLFTQRGLARGQRLGGGQFILCQSGSFRASVTYEMGIKT